MWRDFLHWYYLAIWCLGPMSVGTAGSEVVLTAIGEEPDSLAFAADGLRWDREIVKAAVMRKGPATLLERISRAIGVLASKP